MHERVHNPQIDFMNRHLGINEYLVNLFAFSKKDELR